MVGTVDATAGSREEALAKLRAEIRYRVELCPCSAVPEGYVEFEVCEPRRVTKAWPDA